MHSTTPSIHTLEKAANEFLPKLHGKLPMPRFEIVDNHQSPWLGRCTWQPGEPNTVIEIQRNIFGDEKTLRRVVAHELCHHCDYLTNELTAFEKDPKSFSVHEKYRDGHGPSFHKIAAMLNSVYGKNFVVDKSDAAMNLEQVADYMVLLMRDKGGRIYWAVSEHPTEEQKSKVSKYLSGQYDQREYKLTKSKDPLLSHGTSIGDGFSTPKPGRDQINETLGERLLELWEHGATVPPPHVAHASNELDVFVPRVHKTTLFAGGSVFYVQSSYTTEFEAVANTDSFNAIAKPLTAKNIQIVYPIMEARKAAKLPTRLHLKIPNQLYGIIELEFEVTGANISFLVFADYKGTVSLDIMEGSNRRNLFTDDAVPTLFDGQASTVFTNIFARIRKPLFETMQEHDLDIA